MKERDKMEKRNNRRKVLVGKVVSDKMMKTRTVEVSSSYKHAQYKKLLIRQTRFKAHDENNESQMGDTVEIMETRPLSKDKCWMMMKIIKKNIDQKEVIS